ncbi:MAG: DNA/RNA helicase domain-containing protein [Lachnospirales bacterium]
MIVYEATKQLFVEDVVQDKIEENIDRTFYEKMGYHTSKSERDAWKNSMQYMLKVLIDNNIPSNVRIAIEFKIPNTSKRIDFIISGKDGKLKNTAIIVELKQWTEADIVSGKEGIVSTYTGHALREVAHPSYQAWSYATTIEDYNETVQERHIDLHPCAYLHNYLTVTPPTLLSDNYKEYLEKAPAFVKGDVEKLREFINKYIKYGDDKETLYMIENGKIRPSKSLQDALSSMLQGNQEFVMIDDQKLVYETALKMARKSYKDGNKRVLIVKGGPGTGKSVLAINLLVNLTNENMVCSYVTKNAAPRNVYATKLSGDFRKTRINNLFKGSGSFVESAENEFDVLIVDEAHRLNAKSGMFQNLGENQIKEIIHASKFSIFFIDESQRVTLKDIGSVEEIQKYIAQAEAESEIMELESQFRCNGSDGYIAWIDDVLDIRKTANNDGFDLDYDIKICDTPNEVKDIIFEKNKINNKARLLAGYCWDWIKDGKNKSDVFDITIPEYNFAMSWNLGNSTTWAIDQNSVNEIGCIHTAQGLEFDYAGVIIGNDLRYENNKVITDVKERAKTDQSIKGINKLSRENPEQANKIADEIIKNTYRTLMTRGQKGCYIYCTDKKLSEYLKRRLNQKDEITYSIDEDEKNNLMVAEEGEKYRYE